MLIDIQKIKEWFCRIIATKKQKEILNSVEVGTLVWAKMPLKRKTLKKIEKNHRVRPYIVVYKDLTYVYGVKCSSSPKNIRNNYLEYFIPGKKYRQTKDTYVKLGKIYKVPVNNLKSKYYTLKNNDVISIKKRLAIIKNSGAEIDYNFPKGFKYDKGDVLKDGENTYYVYDVDNKNYYCYYCSIKYDKKAKRYIKANVNWQPMYFNLSEKLCFSQNKKMDIINIATEDEIKFLDDKIADSEIAIKAEKNLNKNNKQNVNCFMSGSVYKGRKHKIVYLFQLNGKNYGVDTFMYNIEPELVEIENIEKKKVVEKMSAKDLYKIVEYLCSKKIKPIRPLNHLRTQIEKNLKE